MQPLYLKPAVDPEGVDGAVLCITDPVYLKVRALRHLPAEGRLVDGSFYWARRIRAGEVIVCDPETHEPLPLPEEVEADVDPDATA